jgi:hypothetical protein
LTAATSIELVANFNEHANAFTTLAENDGFDRKETASRFSSRIAHRGAAILAAGKRSNSEIALRASGDLVVQVARDESTGNTENAFATSVMMAEGVVVAPQAFSITADMRAKGAGANEAEVLRAELAHATSTLSAQELVEAADDIAVIENLIVKADAEQSIGSDEDASRDFENARERIRNLHHFEEDAQTETDSGSELDFIDTEINGVERNLPRL